MSLAAVVNLRGCQDNTNVVVIDRTTRWGNPFRIGRDGSRADVIEKYKQWLWKQVQSKRILLRDLAELHGRTLGCHCAPLPCHGDVLARAAAWATERLQDA